MPTKETALAKSNHNDMQILPFKEIKDNYEMFVKFSKDLLKENIDFGTIPGTGKPTLLKPGAEKMRMVYQLGAETDKTEETLDLDNDFYTCTYKSTIKTKAGQLIAQCEGSCNTSETKYKYRWIKIEDTFTNEEYQVMKALGTHKKKKGYGDNWELLERTEAENKIAIMNTIQKMAQKRAFVGAMVIAVGASEFYTQDLDDLAADLGVDPGDHIQDTKVEKIPEKKTTPAAKKTTPKTPPAEETEAQKKIRIRNGDFREDGTEKPWFNEKPNFEKFKENSKGNFKSYKEAIDEITLSYKVNREMRVELQKLYPKK